MTLDAIVFDLDGVLVDSETVWDRARRAVVAETAATWRDGATRAMMGMSSLEWSRYLRDELGVPLAPQEISDRVVAHMIGAYEQHLPLLPGAVPARGKPAPDVYLEAARQLGVEPRRAAGVEDSSNGLRAAAAAGMLVVAVPNREFPPDQDALALAALVLDSLDALTPSLLVRSMSASQG